MKLAETPSIPGHEPAGVVTALGFGTTGLSVGQRVFRLACYRDGSLAAINSIERHKGKTIIRVCS